MKKLSVSTLRKLKYGGVAIAISIAFLVAVILFNLLAQALGDRYPLSLDLTGNKVYELSEQSVEFLQTIRQPVSVTVLADEDTLSSAGGYYAQAKEIISQYPKYCPSIQVSFVDPVTNPGIVAQYPDLALTQLDILVVSGEKQVKTNFNSLFNIAYSSSSGSYYIQSSRAEQEITGAITQVVTQSEVKLLFLTGQDEIYPEALRRLLENSGFQVEERNLLTDTLDPDAKIAFLLAPQRDLDLEMVDKLEAFLNNGGNAQRNLIYAPHPSAGALPNLEAYLGQWGIAVGSDIVVESDPAKYANNLSYICLVDYTSDDYAKALPTSAPFLSPLGRTLFIDFEAKGAYATQVLMSYSAGSYAMAPDAPADYRPSEAELHTRPAAIRSTYTNYNLSELPESNLFVFASAASFDEAAIESAASSNGQYLAAMVSSLTEQTNVAVVAAKTIENPPLGIFQSQFYLYSILYVIVFPALIAVAGMIVWLRRRNR